MPDRPGVDPSAMITLSASPARMIAAKAAGGVFASRLLVKLLGQRLPVFVPAGPANGRVARDTRRPALDGLPAARCRWPWSSSKPGTPWGARPRPTATRAGATIADRGHCALSQFSTLPRDCRAFQANTTSPSCFRAIGKIAFFICSKSSRRTICGEPGGARFAEDGNDELVILPSVSRRVVGYEVPQHSHRRSSRNSTNRSGPATFFHRFAASINPSPPTPAATFVLPRKACPT